MKPHITTKPPSPLPWILVGALFALLGAMFSAGVADAANERERAAFRKACDREGGIAFLGKHGNACLWAGAVIHLEPTP